MNIWIIPDTHFYHTNIAKYCDRPIGWQDKIIKQWNYCIKLDDLVIHLGDVMLCNNKQYKAEFKKLITSLNGNKILVRGNHDKETLHWYMNNGFIFACNFFGYQDILFSHKPMELISGYGYNVHGHFHNADKERWEKPLLKIRSDRHLLLILENNEYKPFSIQKIINILKNEEPKIS